MAARAAERARDLISFVTKQGLHVPGQDVLQLVACDPGSERGDPGADIETGPDWPLETVSAEASPVVLAACQSAKRLCVRMPPSDSGAAVRQRTEGEGRRFSHRRLPDDIILPHQAVIVAICC
jgi:hypothetical protein